jgi:hypothetical protein
MQFVEIQTRLGERAAHEPDSDDESSGDGDGSTHGNCGLNKRRGRPAAGGGSVGDSVGEGCSEEDLAKIAREVVYVAAVRPEGTYNPEFDPLPAPGGLKSNRNDTNEQGGGCDGVSGDESGGGGSIGSCGSDSIHGHGHGHGHKHGHCHGHGHGHSHETPESLESEAEERMARTAATAAAATAAGASDTLISVRQVIQHLTGLATKSNAEAATAAEDTLDLTRVLPNAVAKELLWPPDLDARDASTGGESILLAATRLLPQRAPVVLSPAAAAAVYGRDEGGFRRRSSGGGVSTGGGDGVTDTVTPPGRAAAIMKSYNTVAAAPAAGAVLVAEANIDGTPLLVHGTGSDESGSTMPTGTATPTLSTTTAIPSANSAPPSTNAVAAPIVSDGAVESVHGNLLIRTGGGNTSPQTWRHHGNELLGELLPLLLDLGVAVNQRAPVAHFRPLSSECGASPFPPRVWREPLSFPSVARAPFLPECGASHAALQTMVAHIGCVRAKCGASGQHSLN